MENAEQDGDIESDESADDARSTETESDRSDAEHAMDDVTIGDRYDALPERIDDEETRDDVRSLLSSVETLETDLEQARANSDRLQSQLEQERSEFKSYRSRMDDRQDEVRDRAVKGLLEELIDVRTNLTRALADDHDDVEGLRDGVRITLQQFDDVLSAEDVSAIQPEPGDEVDPGRHEIIRRVETDGSDELIAELHEPGYEFGDELLRPAKVSVSSAD
ncbi:nucleotide exchange factor GrpE [Halobacteria archaeon AArc-m2/3/4]|uniref:Protein GrpE n=1 Tax=Natronoglomus mannanivorans TaxID=2979990 RepID=A0ABT2QIG7_9EURY|nr:nucleotide exchange factor GrpE [Halobacteria archaeon AArc-m2/3/4]